MGDRDDGRSTVVKKELEPLKHPDREQVAHGADCLDGLRPEVAQLEDPRPPLEGPDNVRGARCEELGGSADHDVDLADERPREDRSEHKTQIVDDPARETLVGGDVGPDPDDLDTVDGLPLPNPVLVTIKDAALREVRCARDYRDLVPCLHPLAAMLVGSARRRIDLGRKIVR